MKCIVYVYSKQFLWVFDQKTKDYYLIDFQYLTLKDDDKDSNFDDLMVGMEVERFEDFYLLYKRNFTFSFEEMVEAARGLLGIK